MGYLTQNLVAESPVFQSKIGMALTKLIDNVISGNNAPQIKMAKIVMQDIPRHAKDLARVLAVEGLDLDALDTAIDASIVGNIKWLIARTEKT